MQQLCYLLYINWTGPWVIFEKLTDVLFKIRHSKNSPNAVVHADNLKNKGEKSVPWYKPQKTILHGQPSEINYFDSEQEEWRNDATGHTNDTDKEPPIRMQSDEREPDENDLIDNSLEPLFGSIDKTLEPLHGSLNKTLEPPEPLNGTGDRSKSVTSPMSLPIISTRHGRIVRIPKRYR
ncbi:unnamed protein product [Mytilus coruscus]|uniref:Integrase p58-like C-terminal domain-containing protein n=1 Tax=Mytilus coruscus TaxID=42192 RepID=A0A6J8AM13_MYTCO|nr:unnamed protein product [Mytilus coruscus]